MYALYQFHCHSRTLHIVQHSSAVANKDASNNQRGGCCSSSSPASQPFNSTLKHSRSTLALFFSVSHSLTLFSSSFFYLRCRWNCLSAAIPIFIPLIIRPPNFDFTSTPPSTYFLRQPSTIYWLMLIIFVLFPYNTPQNSIQTKNFSLIFTFHLPIISFILFAHKWMK